MNPEGAGFVPVELYLYIPLHTVYNVTGVYRSDKIGRSDMEDEVSFRDLLSLFEGEVRGSVMNPYTGSLLRRRDVMDLYHYLLTRNTIDPGDEWSCSMLEVTRDLLDIPSDLHADFLKAVATSQDPFRKVVCKKPVMEEVESVRFFRKGFCRGGAERNKAMEAGSQGEGSRSDPEHGSRGDLLEIELGSLIDQMGQDEIDLGIDTTLSTSYSIFGGSGMMDKVMGLSKKGSEKF